MSGLSPWIRCADCGKIVRVNKPLIGSMHLCVLPEERERIRLNEERWIVEDFVTGYAPRASQTRDSDARP